MAFLIVRASGASAPPATIDYYISPTGSDVNVGTIGSPWAITSLNSKRATYVNKTVGLLDGTYDISGFTPLSGGFDALLSIEGGHSGTPTVIKAVNARQAIIKGNNGASFPHVDSAAMGVSPTSSGGYLTIDGLKFTGFACKTIVHAVSTSDTGTRYPGYIIQNCEITGMDCRGANAGGNNACIQIYISDGAICRNNYCHDNISFSGATSADHFSSIQHFFSDNVVNEYNTLIGGCMYGKDSSCKNPTIRYNYVDMTAITDEVSNSILDYATNSATTGTTSIHHNVLISASTDMRPFPYGAGSGYDSNYEFYNNTVITRNSGASQGLIVRVTAGKASVYNNVFYSQAGGDQAFITINVDADGVIDYDLYYNSIGAQQWGYYSDYSSGSRNGTSFATWKTQMGAGVETHAVNGSDPLFVASGSLANYYKLQSGSPAKNAGKSNGTTGGTTCDIGAWGNSAPAIIGCDFA